MQHLGVNFGSIWRFELFSLSGFLLIFCSICIAIIAIEYLIIVGPCHIGSVVRCDSSN